MENWRYKSYGYSAKRKDKLFFNVLIEDINSTNKHFEHNFICCNITMTRDNFKVNYCLLNNDINCEIELTKNQLELVKQNADKIYNKYFEAGQ